VGLDEPGDLSACDLDGALESFEPTLLLLEFLLQLGRLARRLAFAGDERRAERLLVAPLGRADLAAQFLEPSG
jgi:hypothetical protein